MAAWQLAPSSRAVAWCSGSVIALAVPGILLLESRGAYGDEAAELAWNFGALTMFLIVGVVLAVKVPVNPIGWLLLGVAAAMGLDGLAGGLEISLAGSTAAEGSRRPVAPAS